MLSVLLQFTDSNYPFVSSNSSIYLRSITCCYLQMVLISQHIYEKLTSYIPVLGCIFGPSHVRIMYPLFTIWVAIKEEDISKRQMKLPNTSKLDSQVKYLQNNLLFFCFPLLFLFSSIVFLFSSIVFLFSFIVSVFPYCFSVFLYCFSVFLYCFSSFNIINLNHKSSATQIWNILS